MAKNRSKKAAKSAPAAADEASRGDSFGLFNDAVKAALPSDVYFSALVEQWKTANELTSNISAQRHSINSFYMSLLSLLIGGVLLSDKLMAEERIAKTVMLVVILAVGLACCVTWVRQVDKCKKINYQKFVIIDRLEKQLPANVLSYEGKVGATARTQQKGLSDYEKNLAFVFGAAISLIVVIMLVETWWLPV